MAYLFCLTNYSILYCLNINFLDVFNQRNIEYLYNETICER